MPRWRRERAVRQHSIIVFLALQACSASPGAGTAAQALCFEHVGAQDKPMPAFCVVHAQGGRSAPLPPVHEAVAVSEPAFAEILLACTSDKSNGPAGASGTYRWTRDGNAAPNLLDAAAMTRIAEAARRDAVQRRSPVPDVVVRLLQRLKVS